MVRIPAVSNTIIKVLGGYAGLVRRVLTDPPRWVGLDEDSHSSAPVLPDVLDTARHQTFGKTTSPICGQLPVRKRAKWRLRRIAVSAGPTAAAHRLAGALTDQNPLAAGLSAASTSPSATSLNATAAEQTLPTAVEPAASGAGDGSAAGSLATGARRTAGTGSSPAASARCC